MTRASTAGVGGALRLLAVVGIVCAGPAGAQDLPAPAGKVNDFAQVLEGPQRDTLDLRRLEDRAMRIEVGYGLEGVLPDGLAGSIIRQSFLPRFRAGVVALTLLAIGLIVLGTPPLLRGVASEHLHGRHEVVSDNPARACCSAAQDVFRASCTSAGSVMIGRDVEGRRVPLSPWGAGSCQGDERLTLIAHRPRPARDPLGAGVD